MLTGLFASLPSKIVCVGRNQGPLKAFELLSAENTDGSNLRTYRATFESGMKIRANFAIGAQGKIAGALVRPE